MILVVSSSPYRVGHCQKLMCLVSKQAWRWQSVLPVYYLHLSTHMGSNLETLKQGSALSLHLISIPALLHAERLSSRVTGRVRLSLKCNIAQLNRWASPSLGFCWLFPLTSHSNTLVDFDPQKSNLRQRKSTLEAAWPTESTELGKWSFPLRGIWARPKSPSYLVRGSHWTSPWQSYISVFITYIKHSYILLIKLSHFIFQL